MDGIKQLKTLIADKRAVTALEYGMIAALIALVVIAGFTSLGGNISSMLSAVNASL